MTADKTPVRTRNLVSVERKIGFTPARHKRLLQPLLRSLFGIAADQNPGDIIISGIFFWCNGEDPIVEARNLHLVARSLEFAKDLCQVGERLIHHAGNFVVEPITVGEQDVVHLTDELLVLLDSLFKAKRSKLFLAFNQKDNIVLQLTLVVADSAAIQVAVGSLHGEWICLPLPLAAISGDNIVVTIKENSFAGLSSLLLGRKPSVDDWVVMLLSAKQLNMST
ncbi:hypothetical protein HG531_007017 [Fusarium graminearum]|nr:hypothetical protein HG531_007017 [Fusarium graminearum]